MISSGNDRAEKSAQSASSTNDLLCEGRDFAGRQSQGARESQEDSYGVVPRSEFVDAPPDLFLVVADGMGGHAAGALASSLAVQTFAETFLESQAECDAGRLWDCLEAANHRIARELAARGSEISGMGTTLLAVLLRGQSVRWISVGDSPLYRLRDGICERLNAIHSKKVDLAREVQAGRITAEQARNDPARHTLTSALIGGPIYEVDDPQPEDLIGGDVLLAATDGIESLTPGEIAEIVLEKHEQDAAAMATALINAVEAKQKPKQDNTTLVVIHIPD